MALLAAQSHPTAPAGARSGLLPARLLVPRRTAVGIRTAHAPVCLGTVACPPGRPEGKPVKSFAKNVLSEFGIHVSRSAFEHLDTHLMALIRRLDINCILDVGAHHGEYGTILRDAGYKGRIVSFEPVSAHFAVLAERARCDRQWKVLPIALGVRDEAAEINLFEGTTFASLLTASDYGTTAFPGKMRSIGKERIRTRRLEDMFDECVRGIGDPRVLLKTDCQGLDLQVLQGAGARLAEVCAVQSEVSVNPIYSGMSNTVAEFFPALLGAGFRLTGLFPVNRDRNDGLSIVELDCVFFRPPVRPSDRTGAALRALP